MSTTSRSNFEQCALASGLLTPEQLDEARSVPLLGGGPVSAGEDSSLGFAGETVVPDDQQLAERLVELGHLNAWQTQQLLQGRTKFTLGPYRIVDSLGQGGMGQVFKGEHQVMGRVVAIKVLPREKSTPESIANFTREIQALARLNHRKLVRALDAGQDGKVYFMVTEYVPGSDLRKLVRRNGPLGMEAAASIISQVAEGLEHAHQQGIVHRDVKPGNVIVTPEGEAKLLDLGLAGPLDGNLETDPRYGKIVGTADYISPDHIRAPREPTPAWDIYSLGCTLYYAVTGKVPFPGGTTAEKAHAHCELRPLDPRRINHRLSDDFVDVIADMMAKDPLQRVQSASEVVERLARWACRAASGEPAMPPVPWDALPARPGGAPAPLPPQRPGPSTSSPIAVTPVDGFEFRPTSSGPPAPIVAGPLSARAPIAVPPVLPPPVIRPPLTPGVPLSSLGEVDSDSDDSMSLIVDTRHRWLWPVALALGAPALLAILGFLGWAVWRLMNS